MKRANWDSFEELIRQKVSAIDLNIVENTEQLEEIVKELTDNIHTTMDQTIPTKKQFKKSLYWWTPEINSKRKEVNRLRRKYQRSKDQTQRTANKILYSAEKENYKKLIKKSKTDKWRKFCTESEVWGLPFKVSFDKLKPNISPPNIIKNDGNYTRNPKESIEFIFSNLLPDDDLNQDNEHHKTLREAMNENIDTENDIDFTISELSQIINSLKKNKLPGWDLMNDQIIKAIFETQPEFILKMFNTCLKFNYFPKIWKISIIRMILKSKDKPKEEITSYRLISLLCFFAKIYEKLLIDRINWHLNSKRLLLNNQFGFRPQSSTQTALKHLISKVKNQLNENKFLLFIILDIRGAFDNCFWPSIISQLRKKKTPKNLFLTIKSYSYLWQ
jgi:hypothetical protein